MRLYRHSIGALGLVLALAPFGMSPAPAAELRWSAPLDAYTLDPHSVNNTFILSFLGNVYEPLVRRGADLSLEPSLADKWVQTDDTTWRFTLRRDVKFHDGSSFDAKDVVFSFKRAQPSGVKNMLSTVQDVVAVDDFTVDFKTKGADPILPEEITGWYIMDEQWAVKNNTAAAAAPDNKGTNFATLNTNGTGPFRITVREPEQRTVLEAYAGWWDKAAHTIDKATFRPIASPATRIAALLSGELDMVESVPPQDAKRVEDTKGLRLIAGPDLRVIYFQLDTARDELLYSDVKGKNPFKDQRVRQAIQMAIDSNVIHSRVMRGFSVPTGTLIAREVNGFSPSLGTPVAFNPDKAKALLAEAGYPNGFGVTLDCTSDRFVMDEPICNAVSGFLSRIGIKIENRTQPVSKWAQQINPPGYNTSFVMVGYTPATYDAHNVLQTIVGSRDAASGRGIFNIGGYSDPKVDDLIAGIQVERDAGKRRAMIKDALEIAVGSGAYIPLHQQMILWGVKDGVEVTQVADSSFPLRLVRIK